MNMCYRGVEYDRSLANAQTIQMKFMGQFFDKKVFSLATTEKNIKFMGNNNCSVINSIKTNAIA
jgi:hypothetical protein